MKAAERRAEILKILCRRRYETISVLAAEFNVSERTIRRDIESLSLTAPLYTKAGRYEGGVYILGDYTMDRIYFKPSEEELIQKIVHDTEENGYCKLNPVELASLKKLLSLYSKPNKKGEYI